MSTWMHNFNIFYSASLESMYKTTSCSENNYRNVLIFNQIQILHWQERGLHKWCDIFDFSFLKTEKVAKCCDTATPKERKNDKSKIKMWQCLFSNLILVKIYGLWILEKYTNSQLKLQHPQILGQRKLASTCKSDFQNSLKIK